MLRKLLLPLLALAILLALGITGCSQPSHIDSKLVGSWSPSTSPGLVWQFNADGSFVQKSAAAGKGGLPNTTGKYTVTGNDLSMTLDLKGKTVTTAATLDWISDNQVSVSVSGMTPIIFPAELRPRCARA
jgi:uncharacterized protein (TIGR03066 family)